MSIFLGVLFVGLVDLAHLHFLVVLLLLEISNFPAYFNFGLKVFILLLELLLVLWLRLLQKLLGFLPYLPDSIWLVDTIPKVNRSLFLLLLQLFLYFLLVSELFHFLRVFDQVLWELAYYFQSLLRADGTIIQHLYDGQVPDNINPVVGVKAHGVLLER